MPQLVLRLLLCVSLCLPGRAILARETAAAVAPGLALCFRALGTTGDDGTRPDCRVARLAALRVEAGRPPTPFLPAGPFEATWSGYLESEFLDDYTFSATGRGRFELRLNGETVHRGAGDELSRSGEVTVELEQGRNALQVVYRSPPAGPAVFHLHWSSLDFRTEPVPPQVLSHASETPRLRDGLARRKGRELFATHRCAACHLPVEEFAANAMPELDSDAPSLTGVGSRLHRDWMARWIADPRALRPGATMPALFHAGERAEKAADIASYLATLSGPEAEPGAAAGRAEAGRALADDLGCSACHVSGEEEGEEGDSAVLPPELEDRVDLRGAKSKWKPGALVRFLRDPHRLYRWIRMPDFKLNDAEASDLASWVLSLEARAVPAAAPAGDPTRGKLLVETSGCLSCHTLESGDVPGNRYRAPGLNAIAAASSPAGCLLPSSKTRDAPVPDLSLDDDERESVHEFLKGGLLSSLGRRDDLEFATRRIESLRCIACHSRDGRLDLRSTLSGGVDPTSLLPPDATPPADGEEKTAVQARPDLTWTGAKLRPEWLARFVGGELPYEIRPWLRSRMPVFALDSGALARGLALQHGVEATVAGPPEKSDARLAEIGRRLVLVDGGFACVTCHEIGDFRLSGAAFDVRGINFKYVTRRLRKAFYHRWMLDPLRVVPGSRMPRFTDPEGRTPFTDVLDGDGPRQFEALWQYFLEGDEIRPPRAN